MKPVGTSIEGRPIEAFVRPRKGAPTVLILGGIHGDEPKGVFLARRLIRLLETDSTVGRESRWIVVPVVNPDGYERRRRRNANRVDVNRNFPTANWERTSRRSRMYSGEQPASEPETRAVMAVVQRSRPSRIITIHSIDGHRECNNYDGPARAIALRMKQSNGYPVTSSMGYPTPGSFGTWAGVERDIPTITLELPSDRSPQRCWEDNRRALLCLT